MTGVASGSSAEWRKYFMLPIAAGLGYATSVIHIYGLGPYIQPLSAEFGWSRTQTTAGLTLATLVQAVCSVPIGMLVDRMGPRVLGIVGVLLTAAAFALMSTATGDVGQWYLLWFLMAVATLPVQATIWTSAVASRFEASRGLAFAVTLCGASVAAALFPYLGTRLIDAFGWRTAFAAQAGIWMLCTYPLIFLFFRGAHDSREAKQAAKRQGRPALTGAGFLEGLRSSVYLRLLIASLLFTFTIIALVVHFVPILTSTGHAKLEAAGIASLIGIFSIFGRLGTGMLLDRFPASLVGGGVFLLPVAGCALLIASGGDTAGAMGAAVLIGLTLGAEVDVIVYLTTKHFGLKSFGALYGGLLAALSVGTATGPLGASHIFDTSGGYGPFLWLTMAFMAASSLALVSLPQPGSTGGASPVPKPA
ncbi:MFS transporter [Phenylobacterium sp. LjRoot219]|uniref:MFS transporter n=1 Tax=Phenylobacterium sp. LjRoot219 TaxID=3342283 RepID=UPI003ED008A9